jgi:Spy/CpxP family protein refolding chaperone
MKRKLILTFLACGAGIMLGVPAQAITADTGAAASPSAAPAVPTDSTPAAPDKDPGAHHRGAGILRHLTDALSLSGTQQAAVAQILEAAKPKMQAIREKAKADRDALVDSVSAQITPLLTPDQQAKFSELVQNFKNRPAMGGEGAKKHGGGKEGPEAQLQRLTTALGLTADQQNQIKPILETARAQVKSIFANSSLTPQQKFAQFKQAMDAAHSQINGILTAPQQAQYAALKEKVRHHLRGQGEAPAIPGVSATTST